MASVTRVLKGSVGWASLVVVALASLFLGFYQCGGLVWVKQAATAIVFVASGVVVSVAAVDPAAPFLSARLVRSSVLAALAFVIYLVCFRVGAYAYLAPTSWARIIDPSC